MKLVNTLKMSGGGRNYPLAADSALIGGDRHE